MGWQKNLKHRMQKLRVFGLKQACERDLADVKNPKKDAKKDAMAKDDKKDANAKEEAKEEAKEDANVKNPKKDAKKDAMAQVTSSISDLIVVIHSTSMILVLALALTALSLDNKGDETVLLQARPHIITWDGLGQMACNWNIEGLCDGGKISAVNIKKF